MPTDIHDSERARGQLMDALGLRQWPDAGYRQEEFLEDAIYAGFSVPQIAAAYDVHPATVYGHIDALGLDPERPPENDLARKLAADLYLDAIPVTGYRDKEFMKKAFSKGWTEDQLVDVFDVTKETIREWVLRHGLDEPHSSGKNAHGLGRKLMEMDPSEVPP